MSHGTMHACCVPHYKTAKYLRASERKAQADHAGEGLTSPALAERYGLGSRTAARNAMPRLARRGLVEHARGDRWRIIDPFLAEWLRRNSPFGQ